MEAREIEHALDKFARDSGFEPKDPFYIYGDIRCNPGEGDTIYSDSATLYCFDCARRRLALACPFLPHGGEQHCVEAVDPGCGEDTMSSCEVCGVDLDCTLTEAGVGYEMDHYRENPPSAPLTGAIAWNIARVVEGAHDDAEVLALGEAAIAAIPAPKEEAA